MNKEIEKLFDEEWRSLFVFADDRMKYPTQFHYLKTFIDKHFIAKEDAVQTQTASYLKGFPVVVSKTDYILKKDLEEAIEIAKDPRTSHWNNLLQELKEKLLK